MSPDGMFFLIKNLTSINYKRQATVQCFFEDGARGIGISCVPGGTYIQKDVTKLSLKLFAESLVSCVIGIVLFVCK